MALKIVDAGIKYLRQDEQTIFGVILLLYGDLSQTLLLVKNGTKADEFHSFLKSSYLWYEVKKFCLRANVSEKIIIGYFAYVLLTINNM